MKFNTSKLLRSALPLPVALLLAACGGGGGGAAGPSGGGYTYTVSGTVSGLSGTVMLQNNGGEKLTVSGNGNFAFATSVTSGNAYSVTVLTQPTNQRCLVANGTGNASANVVNVSVSCASQMAGAMQGVALNLAPTVSTLAGSDIAIDGTGPAATFKGPSSVASDGAYLYVTDVNKIRKIEIATGVVTTLAGTGEPGAKDGAGATATFRGPSGITIDVNKTCLYVADSGNNKIRKIAPSSGTLSSMTNATALVSSFTGAADTPGTVGFADGLASVATFNSPTGITSDSYWVYVADSGNNKIRAIDIVNSKVYSWTGATSTSETAGVTDGASLTTATSPGAKFSNPVGITADITAGSTILYVTDNNKIRKIDPSGQVSSLTGALSTAGIYGATDGAGATAATFNGPSGITSDGINLYVTDSGNNKIRKIAPSSGTLSSMTSATAVVTSFTGAPSTAVLAGAAGGAGATATFNGPGGITAVGGTLYVADGGSMIRTVDASSNVLILAGSPIGTDGTGAAASFRYSHGVTSDGANLYVAESDNNKIRKIVIATGVVTTFAGTGIAGALDGSRAVATFDSPYGITTDGTSLYVVDSNNNKIRKIVIATGEVSTVAGVAYTADATCTNCAVDGAGTTATFNVPHDITTDGTNLYVSDSYNNKVRKIASSSGTLSSMTSATAVVSSFTGVANTPDLVGGSVDGAATAATFDFPWGITTDGTNLYVADWGNSYKIRQIVIATGEVSTLAGTGAVGALDGAGAAATFSEPQGITCDGTNLYVVDQSNNKIRKIVIATKVVSSLTGAPSTPASVGAADGAGAGATFNAPHGITTDGSSLYVVDDHTIRKIK
jgi:sugar lactone lactonase YvrE